MSFLEIKCRIVNYYFNEQEKNNLAAKVFALETDAENEESELAALVKSRKAKIAVLKSKAQLLKTNYLQGFEEREKYVYARKDYVEKMIYYIDRETGEVIEKEEFTPRDEMRQLDIASEEIKNSEETIESFAIEFFNQLHKDDSELYDNFLGYEFFNDNKMRYIALAIGRAEKRNLLTLSGEVTFDSVYDAFEPIFVKWISNFIAAPDLPIFDENEKMEFPEVEEKTEEEGQDEEKTEEASDELAFPHNLPENPEQKEGEEGEGVKEKPKKPKKK